MPPGAPGQKRWDRGIRCPIYHFSEFCAALRANKLSSHNILSRKPWVRALRALPVAVSGSFRWPTRFGVQLMKEWHLFMFSRANSQSKAIVDALDRSQAIIRFEPDGTIKEANQRFLDVVGYSRAEVVGHHHRMFVPEALAKSDDYRQFWRRLARGEFQSGLFKRVSKTGGLVWLQASYNPIFGRDGKTPIEVVKFATDVTDTTLEYAELQGQIAAINRSQAVIHFATDGQILWANDNFLKACDYTLKELVGQHHKIFVTQKEAQSEDYRRFWKSLAAGKIQSGQFQRIRKDGSSLWLEASYNPIFDPDGAVIKVIKYGVDVTEKVTGWERAREVGQQVDQNLSKIVRAIESANSQATDAAGTSARSLETMQTVAAAAEEFQRSAESISDSMQQSREQVEGAREETVRADALTSELATAAEDMNNIVELIRDISEQTNLLALNATIEAARAGAAGKGFAVVAQEVKQLAGQSAQATDQISKEIARAQTTTNNVVERLEAIRKAVGTVEESISSVAGSVEEQSASSREMASSVNEATQATSDTNDKLDAISSAVAEASQLAVEGTELYRSLSTNR